MRNKRFMLIAILILAVGFASVSTVLYITGNLAIATNDDFDVYFSGVILDHEDKTNELVIDKKHIVYKTKELKKVNDESILEYEVTNGSTQYDADVTITCLPSSSNYYDVSLIPSNFIVEAGHVNSCKIKVTLKKYATEIIEEPIECELVANAIERVFTGDEVSSVSNYQITGTLKDSDGIILSNKNLVVYSETPHYVTTDDYGFFYVSDLERGSHEIYYLGTNDASGLTKEEVKEQAIDFGKISTNEDTVVFNDIVLYNTSIIKERNIELTVNLDGNNNDYSNNLTINKYDKIQLPSLKRESYDFVGWYDGDKKITSNTIITNNMNIIARWEKVLPPNVIGGSNDWKTSAVVSVEENDNAFSGVKNYEYYYSNSNIAPSKTTVPSGTGNTVFLNETGQYYVYFRTVSNDNNVSEWSNYALVKIDTNAPTLEFNNNINSIITKGDDYNIISSYGNIGPSPVSLKCKTNTGVELTNLKVLNAGNYNISCTATTAAGLSKTISKNFNITYNSYSLRNLLVNGSFENGTTSWGGSGFVISNDAHSGKNSVRMNYNLGADTGGAEAILTQTLPYASPTVNHKYYGMVYFKAINNFTTVDSRFEWFSTDKPNALLTFGQKNGNYPGWTKLSSIQYITTNEFTSKTWIYRNFIRKGNAYSYIDDQVIVDLTATFGAGNEPNKEWCDKHIEFFEGTITIYK